MKKSVLFLSMIISGIAFICASCEEDYDAKTYFKTIGVGYVHMYDSEGNFLYPVKGAVVACTTRFMKPQPIQDNPPTGGGGMGFSLFGFPPIEVFSTDPNGKFKIRFIKRTMRRDVEGRYEIMITYSYLLDQETLQVWGRGIDLSVEEVKNAPNNIIVFDTIKFIK